MTQIDEEALKCAVNAFYSVPAGDARVRMDFAITAYLTALEAKGYVIEQGWQPIETAPVQDEFNPFLVTNGTSIWVADFWFEQEPEQYVFGSSGSPCSGATHWRPLPEPPAMLSATDGEAGGG